MEQSVRTQQGYPPGTFLSDFALPDLSGKIVRVSDLLGQPYLLLFVAPSCEPSGEVMRYLSALRMSVPEPPRVIVVFSGGVEAARTIDDQFQLGAAVVVQEEQELLQFMRVPATPAAYSVNATRTTVGPLAIGAEAVIDLLPAIITPADPELPGSHYEPRLTPVVPAQHLRRHGLRPGSVAPDFELLTIRGEFVTLASFRGRWTLLVFWSPECPLCEDVAGVLAAAVDTAPGLAIVVVSRGVERDHLEFFEQLGPAVQVGLQDRRRVARAYELFDTPAAYLIDPAGRIAEPGGAGRQAVLRLIQLSVSQVATSQG